MVTVYAPIPGYYYTAAIAGQTVGKEPQEPLTNVPVSGFEMTNGSQDKFIEDDLNTMASGGTWILTQSDSQAPLVNRHQLSTDITSVAKRELSITNTLDYAAKMLRQALNPYIGRYNITPSFLNLVNSVLVSASKKLIRNGVVEDISSISVEQDANQKDTLIVSLDVKVKYPVNYIKIKLIF